MLTRLRLRDRLSCLRSSFSLHLRGLSFSLGLRICGFLISTSSRLSSISRCLSCSLSSFSLHLCGFQLSLSGRVSSTLRRRRSDLGSIGFCLCSFLVCLCLGLGYWISDMVIF